MVVASSASRGRRRRVCWIDGWRGGVGMESGWMESGWMVEMGWLLLAVSSLAGAGAEAGNGAVCRWAGLDLGIGRPCLFLGACEWVGGRGDDDAGGCVCVCVLPGRVSSFLSLSSSLFRLGWAVFGLQLPPPPPSIQSPPSLAMGASCRADQAPPPPVQLPIAICWGFKQGGGGVSRQVGQR